MFDCDLVLTHGMEDLPIHAFVAKLARRYDCLEKWTGADQEYQEHQRQWFDDPKSRRIYHLLMDLNWAPLSPHLYDFGLYADLVYELRTIFGCLCVVDSSDRTQCCIKPLVNSNAR
jgi:hypothetical protein